MAGMAENQDSKFEKNVDELRLPIVGPKGCPKPGGTWEAMDMSLCTVATAQEFFPFILLLDRLVLL